MDSLSDSNDRNGNSHSSYRYDDIRASMHEYVENKLQYFKYKRAYGGHANDGDSIAMTIGVTPKFLASIGAEHLASERTDENQFYSMDPLELLKSIQLQDAVSARTVEGMWVSLKNDGNHLISMEMACGYEVNSDILMIASKIEEYAQLHQAIIDDPPKHPDTDLGHMNCEPSDRFPQTRSQIDRSTCNLNSLGYAHVDRFSLVRCTRSHIKDCFDVSSTGEIRATLLEITDIWGLGDCSFEYHSVAGSLSIGDYASIVECHLKKLKFKEIANFAIESQMWASDSEYILSLSEGGVRKNVVILSQNMGASLAGHLISLMNFQFTPHTRLDVKAYPELKDVLLKFGLE
ncbi:MAG: hypothetical protein IPK50_13020 [Fibrobacterota bacterium]|nr:hypothetical protein [Fibrobacterota bacterium]QQS03230.1 MAG: hypothetical protein IPK50_13020 [Fibrobacterota bacterium]